MRSSLAFSVSSEGPTSDHDNHCSEFLCEIKVMQVKQNARSGKKGSILPVIVCLLGNNHSTKKAHLESLMNEGFAC